MHSLTELVSVCFEICVVATSLLSMLLMCFALVRHPTIVTILLHCRLVQQGYISRLAYNLGIEGRKKAKNGHSQSF
jgi:hypothetical protein